MTAVQLVAHLSALGYEASVYIADPDDEFREDGVVVRWREPSEEGAPAYQAQLEADAGMSVGYAEWVLGEPASIDFYFFTADLGNLMPPRVHHHRMRRRP